MSTPRRLQQLEERTPPAQEPTKIGPAEIVAIGQWVAAVLSRGLDVDDALANNTPPPPRGVTPAELRQAVAQLRRGALPTPAPA